MGIEKIMSRSLKSVLKEKTERDILQDLSNIDIGEPFVFIKECKKQKIEELVEEKE